ncbi:MAG: hypothetical protein ACSHW0_13365 [Thalassotalea sp.]
MSIWQELYNIFDKERTLWLKSTKNKQALHFEIQNNLVFLADALKQQLAQQTIING